jgi:hypothetical protein
MPTNFADTSQAVQGIAKNMSWKWMFFGAACCTMASAIISILYLVFSFKFMPFSFTTVIFMFVFGFFMLVLDFPIPHPDARLASVRGHIYKFLLFMTRFTGRGIWYLFLGTMIWATLYDLEINWFFGICLGGYVGILGIVTLVFGYRLSRKLDSLRKELLMRPPQCPPNGLTPPVFLDLSRQYAPHGIPLDFTEDELIYIFNSLSFTAQNDMVIKYEEFNAWLQPGTMEIV